MDEINVEKYELKTVEISNFFPSTLTVHVPEDTHRAAIGVRLKSETENIVWKCIEGGL